MLYWNRQKSDLNDFLSSYFRHIFLTFGIFYYRKFELFTFTDLCS